MCNSCPIIYLVLSLGKLGDPPKDGSSDKIAAKTFTFREMAVATKNFRGESFIGEGGFGRVYKGQLEGSNQVCYYINFGHLIYITNCFLIPIVLFFNWYLSYLTGVCWSDTGL